MLINAIAALTIGFAGNQPPLCCPATLEEVTGAPAISMEYNGAVFGTCCGGCDTPFKADPSGLITKAIKAKKTVGAFQYDPVSGVRIDGKKAAAYSDYKSIRYFFASDDEKKSFDAAPAKFVADVKSDAYFCPVQKHGTAPQKAGAFADYEGVRYFLCCGDCLKAFKADPAKFAANATQAVAKPSVTVLQK